jgi:hypothetical protein
MLRRLRENGPVVLVPLAWTFAIAAHRDLLALRTVLIAHLVMDSIILVFTVLSWRDMDAGILLTWRRVLVAGFVLTAAGTVGLVTDPPTDAVLAGTVAGWLAIPAAGLLDTGRRIDRLPTIYLVGGALSALGAVGYVLAVAGGAPLAVTAALAVGGAGQTAGIVAAVVAY